MRDLFITNKTDIKFIDKIRESFSKCKSFSISVSFIKKAGLVLIEKEIEDALERGVKGRIITSTYQNFTDINSLNQFNEWKNKYKNFDCHLDLECFGEDGFHSKGYLFEYEDSYEFIVGSTNITRFALIKNVEWNVSLISKEKNNSYVDALKEFEYLWEKTLELDSKIIKLYSIKLDFAIEKWDMDYVSGNSLTINPNSMQRKALKELRRYRDMGVQKALVISATGSGKTYLAAFDARNVAPNRLLYVVHRDTILKDARDTFEKVFGADKSYGFYTGKKQDLDCNFIFATSTMLAKHIDEFDKKEFDYIVYDEVHHIVADCGKKIFNYFKPQFLLGLTATPERMDNQDVFELFDQNVPFELRLRDAILNDLVVPFHYYGIRSKLVDYSSSDRSKIAKEISEPDNVDFISKEIEKHRKEGEKLKALAFCTNIAHCSLMAQELQELGYNTVALTGQNDLGERIKAFKNLQDETNPLEIICAVDILNEGIDIPAINMVLFLRPTESQTVFIQQLGRGLRKFENKEYVTVLDFIGNNYDRSVQIALALGTLGKTTYTEKAYLKDLVRTDFRGINIPGVEINIDELAKEEIIHYIDNTNFNNAKILKQDYENFKKYLQTQNYPSHMDYINSEVSPELLRFMKVSMKSKKNRSYYSFLRKIGEESLPIFSDEVVEVIDNIEDMLPLVRIDEYLILKQLIEEKSIDLEVIDKLNPNTTMETLKHAYSVLKAKGIVENDKVDLTNISQELYDYLEDTLEYGITRYDNEFGEYEGEFKLYGNYYKEQIMLKMYRENDFNAKQKGTWYEDNGDIYCFVGLHKEERNPNYNDRFLTSEVFQWESETNVKPESKYGQALLNSKDVYLFVRKMEKEDGISLPFTYFGKGKFRNPKISSVTRNGKTSPTILFKLQLENQVPQDYFLDFDIKEEV